MNAIKMLGIALLIAGVLGLVYGGFSYTKDTTAVKLGPIELTVKKKANSQYSTLGWNCINHCWRCLAGPGRQRPVVIQCRLLRNTS